MDNDLVENGIGEVDEKLGKFWTSFYTWSEKSEIVEEFFKSKYSDYNNWNEGYFYSNIDYEEEYKDYYGTSYPMTHEYKHPPFKQIVDYLEIGYARWIRTEKRYAYTIEVNNRLEKFGLPYRLSSGKVSGKGYKTTESIGKILNYRMFERKIQFADENILSSEMLDKKTALDYIIDALQFLLSVQNAEGIDKKKACAALSVSDKTDRKMYAVIKREIEEIMTISNEYFDIRHNEYLNKAKQVREVLEDAAFIEYLYNRAYALLYILRLRADKSNLIFKVE